MARAWEGEDSLERACLSLVVELVGKELERVGIHFVGSLLCGYVGRRLVVCLPRCRHICRVLVLARRHGRLPHTALALALVL
jgi:hypothetical protein